ncbi:ribonucleases P/MRP protein subunit Pop1p [[Candida] anglica]|uniref:Ribonucleases P/MRP protein subunit Pop1p n=1 Tax=[Candida] anglica TaxID=148631 RepID=A0ABP0ECS2_9ASCO
MPPKQDINNKKAKLYSSRTIRTEFADPNYKEGKLSVPDFLASREFEIRSLELAKLKSKYALSNRCFQSLPRSLRRRTASHNVKRIPKRLRNRAIKEMQNSANGVPPKPKHLRGKELYRLKMKSKLLRLASRVKLLSSVPGVEMRELNLRSKLNALQRQIKDLNRNQEVINGMKKLNNTMGSYDNTGVGGLAPAPRGNLKYTKRQKDFVWLPTHIWHAKRAHLIKKFGYQIPLRPTQKCFKSINRASKNGTIVYDTSYYDYMIVTVTDLDHRGELLKEITKFQTIPSKYLNGACSYDDWLYKDGKVIGKGLVYCHDVKILIRVYPSMYTEYYEYVSKLSGKFGGSVHDCRYSLGSIELTGPESLRSITKIFHLDKSNEVCQNWLNFSSFKDSGIPSGTTFSFNVQDPRLWTGPTNPPPLNSSINFNDLIIGLQNQPSRTRVDPNAIETLLDNEKRNDTYKDQLSIKKLSKKFSESKTPIIDESQPQIPILITKLTKTSNNWCVTLPWYWVLPVWIQLTKVTNVKLGGLQQMHQINLENNRATFPTDFPFLRDGYLENEFKILENEKKYNKIPASHKLDYHKLGMEHGNFHGSDWRFLQLLSMGLKYWQLQNPGKELPKTSENYASFNEELHQSFETLDDLLQLIEQAKILDLEKKERGEPMVIPIERYEKKKHNQLLNGEVDITLKDSVPILPIVQVKISMKNKGHPTDNARIFKVVGDINSEEDLKKSACIENLIGYVTSGTFNLNSGHGSGIGCLSAFHTKSTDSKYVIIRNIGCSEPRVGEWETI